MLNVTVLCSVIDNYGDIGFVYRLCRRLSEITKEINLRIVVDNLKSFAFMNSKVKIDVAEQKYNNWKIFDWNNYEICKKEFLNNEPEYILQCFQCKLPNWLEDILYDGKLKKSAYIINVEYLTAEKWADDFHKLRSGTRSIQVHKSFFMPGFTNKTGGLVLDENFTNCIKDKKYAYEKAIAQLGDFQKKILNDDEYFKILIFSYSRSFDFLVNAINSFVSFNNKKVHVFVANGISSDSFINTCKKTEIKFEYSQLPALNQEQWDSIICLMNFNFIRGEDSFSRASLCGIPFIWHVYVQDEEYQLVKLNAFLDRIKAFFEPTDFDIYKKFCFLYNRSFSIEPGDESCQAIATLNSNFPKKESDAEKEMEELILNLLNSAEKIKINFKKSAVSFLSNGDLAKNLLEFMQSLVF